MCVAEINGVEQVENAQAEIHVGPIEIQSIPRVKIKQSVGWNLPRLPPFVFAVQAEGIEVRKVPAENRKTRFQVELLVRVFQRDAVLALG